MAAYRGERNKQSKLTHAEVLCMRILSQDGINPYRLAAIFNVSRTHAKRIIRNEKWSWLPSLKGS